MLESVVDLYYSRYFCSVRYIFFNIDFYYQLEFIIHFIVVSPCTNSCCLLKSVLTTIASILEIRYIHLNRNERESLLTLLINSPEGATLIMTYIIQSDLSGHVNCQHGVLVLSGTVRGSRCDIGFPWIRPKRGPLYHIWIL